MTSFKSRLKEVIDLKKVTQAEVCQATSIPKSALSSYLSGKYEAKQDRIYILAKYFNVSEAWLMGCDVPMERITKTSEPAVTDSLADIKLSPIQQELLNLLTELSPQELKQVFSYADFLRKQRECN